MKIIIIDKTTSGYQARLFGKQPVVQTFAKTEIEALKKLVDKLEKRHSDRVQ